MHITIALSPEISHFFSFSAMRGAPLQNCFGFVDGTLCKLAKPKNNQRVLYNGHKRVPAIKFQSVVTPNGLIANLAGPFEGQRHNCMMLHETGILRELPESCLGPQSTFMFIWRPCLGVHLQAPFRDAHLF